MLNNYITIGTYYSYRMNNLHFKIYCKIRPKFLEIKEKILCK